MNERTRLAIQLIASHPGLILCLLVASLFVQSDAFLLLSVSLTVLTIVFHAGDPIAAAGNSGWTERPHLHMQLMESDTSNYWFGRGICIRFQDKNIYKNRIIHT